MKLVVAAAVAILVLASTVAATGLEHRLDPVLAEAPGQEPVPTSAAEDGPSLARLVAQAEAFLGVKADDPGAPPGLRNLAQPANGTDNVTTHRHSHLGNQGLAPVWATAFQGAGHLLLHMDLDGQGGLDTVIGSDIALTALRHDGKLLWAHHIGSRVTSLFETEGGDVGFSTSWGGQNAQVAVLRARDGHEVWFQEGAAAFLDAGPAGDGTGDILAVDRAGRHLRLNGDDGGLVWEASSPTLAAPGVYVLGPNLGAVGDLNGDGVADTVVAHWVWVWDEVSRDSSLIVAVDGRNGDVLWVHDVGGTPSTGFTSHFLYDLELLDARGDGSLDVALVGYSRSSTYAPVPLVSATVYETHLRIIEGASVGAGIIIGTRDLVQPEQTVEQYTRIGVQPRAGGDLLLALRHSVANGALGSAVAIERYAALPHEPAMALVSDVSVAANSGTQILPPVEGPEGVVVPLVWLDGLVGHHALLQDDGTLTAPATLPASYITSLGHDGARFVLVSPERAMLRQTVDGPDEATFGMRGSPFHLDVGDLDADGTEDAWIVSNDGNVYVLDGLTGQILATLDTDDRIIRVHVQRVDGQVAPYVVVLQSGPTFGYQTETRLLDPDSFEAKWSVSGSPVADLWFDADGDGTKDFISDWTNRYDAGSYSLEAVYTDGRTGEELAEVSMPSPLDGSIWPFSGTVFALGDGTEGVAVLDWINGIVLLDGAGAVVASQAWDQWHFTTCMAAVDLDGQGGDEVVVLAARGDDAQGIVFEDGQAGKFDGLPKGRIQACSMQSMDGLDGTQHLLVATSGYEDGSIKRFLGRYSQDGYVWQEKSAQGTPGYGYHMLLGGDARAGDGGRFYYGYQDHVLSRHWSNGTIAAEFTVNGPFVRSGQAVELDGKRPAEVVALTSDGLVWALAEDGEKVAAAMARQAKDQGKELQRNVDGVLDVDVPDKKSPLPLMLVLVALVLLARRRK